MRPPTATERKLLAFLLAAVFVAINLAALRFWTLAARRQQAVKSATASKILEGQSWVLAAESIEGSGEVMASPPASEEKNASSSLLALARAKAGEFGLSVIEEALPPAPPDLPEPAAILKLKVNGPFAGLARFLYAIQEPGQWRSVDQLIVKADPKPQNVLAEMEIRQYYSQQAGAPEPGTTGPAETR